jgi:hypothetical protein
MTAAKNKGQPINYKELGNREMWRLIRRGLSGREAALLWMADSWEVDHGRDDILSAKNMERLEKAVKHLPPRDAEVYQKYLYAYQLLDYTLLEASKKSLEISDDLRRWTFLFAREYFRLPTDLRERFQKLEELQEKVEELQRLHDRLEQGKHVVKPLSEVPQNLEPKQVIPLEEIATLISIFFKSLASFNAYVEVLRAVGKIMKLPVEEDIESFWKTIREAKASFKEVLNMIEETHKVPKAKGPGTPSNLSDIPYPKIKADPEELQYLRERIAMAFGDKWMEEGPEVDIEEEEEDFDLAEEWGSLYGQ